MLGVVPTVQPELSGDFAELMAWADEFRTLGIRANAETPADAAQARKFGAEGIGLCRTEHMFFEGDRIVGRAPDDPGRRREEPARGAGQDPADAAPGLRRPVRDHGRPAGHHPPARSAAARVPAQDPCRHGGRGQGPRRRRWPRSRRAPTSCTSSTPCSAIAACGSASPIPEIYEMQARAIFEAVAEVQKKAGKTVIPEIMIPLVATRKELDLMKVVVDQVASRGQPAVGPEARIPGRHHDRAAARGAAGRRDRRVGRVLQLRHQRSHADHLRPQPRRFGVVPREVPAAAASSSTIPSPRSTSRAWAS